MSIEQDYKLLSGIDVLSARFEELLSQGPGVTDSNIQSLQQIVAQMHALHGGCLLKLNAHIDRLMQSSSIDAKDLRSISSCHCLLDYAGEKIWDSEEKIMYRSKHTMSPDAANVMALRSQFIKLHGENGSTTQLTDIVMNMKVFHGKCLVDYNRKVMNANPNDPNNLKDISQCYCTNTYLGKLIGKSEKELHFAMKASGQMSANQMSVGRMSTGMPTMMSTGMPTMMSTGMPTMMSTGVPTMMSTGMSTGRTSTGMSTGARYGLTASDLPAVGSNMLSTFGGNSKTTQTVTKTTYNDDAVVSLDMPPTETATVTKIYNGMGGHSTGTETDMADAMGSWPTDDINEMFGETASAKHGSMPWTGDMDVTKPTLINFYASWCPASRAFLPKWMALKNKYSNRIQMVQYDCANDNIKNLCNKFKIEAYPTVAYVRNGKVMLIEGAMNEEKCKEIINSA
jgi:thiol-disulfide isomerase/thioredoxin